MKEAANWGGLPLEHQLLGRRRQLVGDPGGDLSPCIVETKEQRLVQQLVAHAAVEAFDEGVLDRLSRCDEGPVDGVSLHQASTALQVNSVPLTAQELCDRSRQHF